ACLYPFSLTHSQVRPMAIRQIPENAKKTEYQTSSPKSEPKIGDKTFPNPLDASMIPRTLLCSPPLKRSPANAIAIGAVPAAPIPSTILPTINQAYELKEAAANPASRPPILDSIREGIIIIFDET